MRLPCRTVIINIPSSGKSHALHLGIYHCRARYIAITDADCRLPVSWLADLASTCPQGSPSLVLGYVAEVPSGGFWQSFQYMEMAGMMVFNAGVAYVWAPVTATAASLLVRREVYAQLGGHRMFQKHISGDDLFLLREVVRLKGRKAVSLARGRGAIVFSEASRSFGEMVGRRHRWASKLTALGWVPNLLAVGLVIAVNALLYWWLLAGERERLTLALVKVMADFAAVASFSTVTGIWRWLPYFMFAQAVYPVYLLVMGMSALVVPRKKW